MELYFKNPKLAEALELYERYDAMLESEQRRARLGLPASADFKEYTDKHPERLIYGYTHSLLEASCSKKINIDFTYDTVKNLSAALGSLFHIQKNSGCSNAKNCEIMAKTLAAYLTVLAINEHNFPLRTIAYKPDGAASMRKIKGCLWADRVSILTGKKADADFLQVSTAAVSAGSPFTKDGCTINVSGPASLYLKLTGVDLTKLGLNNIVLY